MASSRAVRAALSALVVPLSVAACVGAPAVPGQGRVEARSADLGKASVLVIVPHPDDEAIMTAGVIARERASGRRVAVAVVTNGDLSCDRDGIRREGETIAAMSRLGVPEDDVYFLGYPDGHLDQLGSVALEPLPRRTRTGECGAGNTTYAARGAGRTDVHTLLTGHAALYTSDALAFDIASLIDRLGPKDVYVSHPIDEHPDHASVYVFVRRALERRSAAPPRIHRALVHIGGCWPTAAGLPPCPVPSFAPSEDAPPLPPPLERYRPSELVAVPAAMRLPAPEANPKYQAIASYASQTGSPSAPLSYLFSFARAREPFFPETLVEDGPGRWRRSASTKGWRCRGVEVDGERSLDIARSFEGGYALRRRGNVIELERRDGSAAPPAVLSSWALPRSTSDARHRLELAIDVRPEEGGVGELTVRRDGEILGIAVDPEPLAIRPGPAPAAGSGADPRCEPY